MYESFFKLRGIPFTTSPDPRFLYMMPQTREALAGLEYGIAQRKGFIVLTGEVGTGKTTLLRHALNSLDATKIRSSFIFNRRLEALELLEFILADFGILPEHRTKAGMLIQLNRWLIDRYRRKDTCVLVIDEAQSLSAELLEEVRLLTNLETSSEKLLQIILSGQPELEEKLFKPNLRQLRQRVSLWCRTGPISLEQTGNYIAERLRIAGRIEPLFSQDAVRSVYRISRGVPRIINLLCEHALLLAYAENTTAIGPGIIEAVSSDLRLEETYFQAAPANEESTLLLKSGRQRP